MRVEATLREPEPAAESRRLRATCYDSDETGRFGSLASRWISNGVTTARLSVQMALSARTWIR